ncbi:MAG: hypothetical protein Q9184_004559 [Pyrenodesmia sp. 2 TL-2023]
MGGFPKIASLDHLEYMRFALSLAQKSPPKPTNFRVGAVLVDESTNQILSTGFTLELPGNTHAEQCALRKYSSSINIPEPDLGPFLPTQTVLYTTMEPCQKRSAGNVPCVERIRGTLSGENRGIKTVYIGVKEPDTFVAANAGQSKLEEAGIVCIHVPGLEKEIMDTATAAVGHRADLNKASHITREIVGPFSPYPLWPLTTTQRSLLCLVLHLSRTSPTAPSIPSTRPQTRQRLEDPRFSLPLHSHYTAYVYELARKIPQPPGLAQHLPCLLSAFFIVWMVAVERDAGAVTQGRLQNPFEVSVPKEMETVRRKRPEEGEEGTGAGD